MQNIETNIYIIWPIHEQYPGKSSIKKIRRLQKCVRERELRFALVMVHNSKPINMHVYACGFFHQCGSQIVRGSLLAYSCNIRYFFN